MFKISLINSFLCILVKYVLFFFMLAFVDNRFKSVVIDNATTSSEVFKLTLGYILTVLLYTIPMILVFGFLLNYILKIKRGVYFVLSMSLFFSVEFWIYTEFYSPSDKYVGIYNIIIGIIIILMFFYKSLQEKFVASEL